MVKFTLKESQLIYQGKIVTLTRDILNLPNNQEIIREKIFHAPAVAVVPFLEKSKILLIRQYRYSIDKDIWEIPAGILEEGEEILSCAFRELEEETGYKAAQMEELISFYPTPGVSDEEIYVFKATELERTVQNLDDDEHIKEVKIFSLDEIREMIEDKKIIDSKTLIGLFLILREAVD